MTAQTLALPFVPRRVLSLMDRACASTTLPGAVLAADLSDFTGLTEALAQQAGPLGSAMLARELQGALGPAVDTVIAHGGEVVKFAGDGLLCIFPGSDTAAALSAAAELARLQVTGPLGSQHRFRLAVAHGPIRLWRLGGWQGRLELVAGGPAVEGAQQLLEARGWQIGMAPLLHACSEPLPAPQPDEEPRAYLPAYVLERLTAERAAWLQQVRTLTLVFVAIDLPGSPEELEQRMQELSVHCQRVVDGYAGQLLRFGLEGRQLMAELAFGLTVGANATGPGEALRCAVALALSQGKARLGVSTGRVLLGPIGSAARQQLTSLGPAVNLAARLMQRAEPGDVLVDEATWVAAGHRVFVGERKRAHFKGLGERDFHRLDGRLPATPERALAFYGREMESRRVLDVLADATAPSTPLVVQGEAGIGKSRFARWLGETLLAQGHTVWSAACSPMGRDTPYASLAALFRARCGMAPGQDDTGQLRAVAQRVLGDADRAQLLRDALGLQRSPAGGMADTSGQVRADNIRDALLALLAAEAANVVGARVVLLVEDAHWLDFTSWLLLQRLAAEVPAVRLVVVMRPLTHDQPAPLRVLLNAGAVQVDLPPLDDKSIESLVARRLGVRDVPAGLSRWVIERVRGNPFFAEELTTMLASLPSLVIHEDRVLQAPGPDALKALEQASTIEQTVEQRIDGLGVDDAAMLKLASVMGPSFALEEWADLAPSGQAAAGTVAQVAARLVAAEMAVPEGPGRLAFRHSYTQKVAYGMLPPDQQKALHARVAQQLEDRLQDRSDARAADLAHHWYRAGKAPQAARWLEWAGRRALDTGADSEAAEHFNRALELARDEPSGRRASWHRQRAQALFGLGQVDNVDAEARRAFELVAGPLPRVAKDWTRLAATTALRRVVGGLRPKAARRRAGSTEAGSAQALSESLEGSRAAALLAESAYFVNAPEKMLASALLAVDMAERTGLAAPVSTAYGMLAVVMGMARMHGRAQRYLARALRIAEDAQDPYQQGVAWFYAGIYQGCRGDWDASRAACDRGLALTDSLGAYMLSGRQLTIVATNALYTSDYQKTRAWMDTMRQRAERLSNVQQVGWSGNVVSVADLHQQRHEEAVEKALRSRAIFLQERDPISLTISEGVRCAALARLGRMDEALACATAAAELTAGARPTTWGQLEGFAGPCEVFALALAQGRVTRQAVHKSLQPALFALRLFAWVFPFGRARYRWICGQLAMADARPRAARHHLMRALQNADHFQMPYEAWRATELLAELQRPDKANATRHAALKLKERVLAGGPLQGAALQRP